MKAKILIVDDEESLRSSLGELLRLEGYQVFEASNGQEALKLICEGNPVPIQPDVVFLDIRLPDVSGMSLLKRFKEVLQDVSILMLTAYGSVQQSVEAMQSGAMDYILKPFIADEILLRVKKSLEFKGLQEHVSYLSEQLSSIHSQIVLGPNKAMQKVFQEIELLRKSTRTPVLIRGETGTGKEIIARKVHASSKRSKAPFIAINASALSVELLESELFGHEAGAFTGALKTKKGLFEVASKGTLFLDEIGDMDCGLQAKLLRALQEQKIRRVGGTEEITIDVRFIAATNKDLASCIREGTFREDLYYRLNVVELFIPPLRERKEDIETLATYFVKVFNKEFQKNIREISPEAFKHLKAYDWPGNIRELRNVIERSMLLACSSPIVQAEDFSIDPQRNIDRIEHNQQMIGENISLELVEREHIEAVLLANNGNKNLAAQILGIDRTTLYNKLKKYQAVKK
jgi:two-component system response regulator AtoC